jgi:hypothetical protein
MASATGIPQQPPAEHDADVTEPLLGRPGDASQRESASIAKNLILGTKPPSQVKSCLIVLTPQSPNIRATLNLFSLPTSPSLGPVRHHGKNLTDFRDRNHR